MKVKIHDKSAMARLSPLDVRNYLAANGWRELRRYGQNGLIFGRSVAGEAVQILLPLSQTLADFSERMAETLAVLADVEQRSELLVYQDLISSGADIVRLWVPLADEGGTIPLEQGAGVCQHGLLMMAAAARAESKTGKSFRSQHPRNVADYLKTVRLGLTQPGSYVFPIISPVSPGFGDASQLSLFGMDTGEPFSRRVICRLNLSLTAIREALLDTVARDDITPFEAAVDKGVSANLCEAVSQLVEDVEDIRVTTSWSVGRAAPELNKEHQFRQDDRRILDEVARVFRRDEPIEDARLFGLVVKNARAADRLDGKIWLQSTLDDRVRVMQVDLAHAEYEKCVDAHRRKLPILLDGDIYREGRNLVVRSARNVKVVEESSQDESETSTQ